MALAFSLLVIDQWKRLGLLGAVGFLLRTTNGGRIENPMNGAVGLLWIGNWHVCQAAVKLCYEEELYG